jgi:hypothetical protein
LSNIEQNLFSKPSILAPAPGPAEKTMTMKDGRRFGSEIELRMARLAKGVGRNEKRAYIVIHLN